MQIDIGLLTTLPQEGISTETHSKHYSVSPQNAQVSSHIKSIGEFQSRIALEAVCEKLKPGFFSAWARNGVIKFCKTGDRLHFKTNTSLKMFFLGSQSLDAQPTQSDTETPDSWKAMFEECKLDQTELHAYIVSRNGLPLECKKMHEIVRNALAKDKQYKFANQVTKTIHSLTESLPEFVHEFRKELAHVTFNRLNHIIDPFQLKIKRAIDACQEYETLEVPQSDFKATNTLEKGLESLKKFLLLEERFNNDKATLLKDELEELKKEIKLSYESMRINFGQALDCARGKEGHFKANLIHYVPQEGATSLQPPVVPPVPQEGATSLQPKIDLLPMPMEKHLQNIKNSQEKYNKLKGIVSQMKKTDPADTTEIASLSESAINLRGEIIKEIDATMESSLGLTLQMENLSLKEIKNILNSENFQESAATLSTQTTSAPKLADTTTATRIEYLFERAIFDVSHDIHFFE